jgi:hypothetical protein
MVKTRGMAIVSALTFAVGAMSGTHDWDVDDGDEEEDDHETGCKCQIPFGYLRQLKSDGGSGRCGRQQRPDRDGGLKRKKPCHDISW